MPSLRRVLIEIAIVITIGAALIVSLNDRRPSTLSLDMRSHPLRPSYKRVAVNGRQALKWSVRGRSESGDLNYDGRWNDYITFQTWWLDVVEVQVYQLNFTVRASELSNFGPGKEYHTSLEVEFGPGADVTARTPDPNLLAHIGQFGGANLASVPSNPVTLRALCGLPIPASDPVAKELIDFHQGVLVGGDGNSVTIDLSRALDYRDTLIGRDETEVSRCAIAGVVDE